MKLSNSAKDKYVSCGEKYRLHYREKLRGPKIYSSLFFGSALDEAVSRLLLDKKKVTLWTEEEKKFANLSPEEHFGLKMEQVEHNGKEEKLRDNVNCDYYSSDYEESLLEEQDIQTLREYAPDVSDIKAFMATAKAIIKDKKKLIEDDQKLYNYAIWLTLYRKGLLMISAYRTVIMPQIFEVYSIQEEVTLPNETNDELTGKIDFACSFVEDTGTMYICDNKSSSKPYKEDSVKTSEQLATYCEYKSTNKAAYVVIEKKLYKKNGPIRATIIRDEIPEETFSHTFAQYEKVLDNINAEVFDKNFNSCFEYGRMCPYFKLCKHKNADGLVSVKKENKE